MTNQLPGYKLNERVHAGSRTSVWRGRREHDNAAVIVKLPAGDFGAEERAKLRQEYEIAAELDMDGIVRPLALEDFGDAAALVMEDGGGISLDEFRKGEADGRLELELLLDIAGQLAEILGEVHGRGVVHKDLKPQNIIIEQGRVVRLTDFGISSRLNREHTAGLTPGRLQGTLSYLSPEQTGRMNRAVDNRSDFYSLGVTLYELTVGELPFAVDDALELIHCHIALLPEAPHERRPDIPLSLSRLIMKLLAKNAEDRYQSAFGLKQDLSEIARHNGKPAASAPDIDEPARLAFEENFVPGRGDLSDRFQIPQKLYGREAETATLLQSFDRAARGGTEMLLVAGFSGIGKSALVQEVQKPITERRGYFIAGKFDQFKRDLPYSAILQAFLMLIRQILTEEPERIATWKDQLLEALGTNGGVITDVLPELEWIIGAQPPVIELPPAEAENRFNAVFRDFVRILAGERHPLAIFLDDLQWADSASLKLILLLLTDPDTTYFQIIGAFRDNEVDEHHPLTALTGKLEQGGHKLERIALKALDVETVGRIVADTLHIAHTEAVHLAELVHRKTRGNPFFVSEFLRTLYDKELIRFDSTGGRWVWEPARIEGESITDNVVELMAQRIRELPEETGRALQVAACIGSVFELRTLALILEQERDQLARLLRRALSEDLVVPLDQNYSYAENESLDVRYRFLHDRVQQAAYELISSEERSALHRRIGRDLWNNLKDTPTFEEEMFTIVNHLYEGRELLNEPEERRRAAELCLRAGSRALASTAYASAAHFLTFGNELLGENAWRDEYELCRDLLLNLARAQSLQGELDASDRLVDILLKKVHDVREQVSVYEVRLRNLNAQNRLPEALDSGIEVLRKLGVSLPRHPGQRHIVVSLLRTKAWAFWKGKDSLLRAPVMQNENYRHALKILINLGSAAYQSAPNLFAVTVLRATELSYRFGIAPDSPYAVTLYMAAHISALGDFAGARYYGDMAAELIERWNARHIYCRSHAVRNCFTRHWLLPVEEAKEEYMEVARVGRETGDLEYAGYCYTFWTIQALYSTTSLDDLVGPAERNQALLDQAQQGQPANAHRPYAQFILALREEGREEALRSIESGEHFNEEWLRFMEDVNYGSGIAFSYKVRGHVRFIFGEYEAALAEYRGTLPVEESLAGLPAHGPFRFLYAICLCAVARTSSGRRRRRLLSEARMCLRMLKKWARLFPFNYAARYDLLLAEYLYARGRRLDRVKIERLYASAIRRARERNYYMDECHALECAARYYADRDDRAAYRAHLVEAHAAYDRWGARAKVRDLELQHPDLLTYGKNKLEPNTTESAASTKNFDFTVHTVLDQETTGSSTTLIDGGGNPANRFDLAAVVKAARAISGELRIENFLDTLMQIVLENAGARRGVFIQAQDDDWLVRFVRDAGGGGQLLEERLAEFENVCRSVVRYAVQSRQAVVLADAANDASGRFSADPYIREHGVRSLLCTPILRNERILGVLYLENNLSTGAFTEERLRILEMLSSQAAISLETAHLYSHLEEEVVARTDELEASKHELDEILANVGQGILSIDRDGRIGSEYSRAAAEIFAAAGTENLAGRRFADLFAHDERTSAVLAQYVDQLFTNSFMSETMLSRANPIREYQYAPPGTERPGILAFSFSRIRGDEISTEDEDDAAVVAKDPNEVRKVIVSVEDRTRQFELEREIEERRKEQEHRVEKLYQILQLEPRVFSNFLKEGRSALSTVRTRLREFSDEVAVNQSVVEECFRGIHSLKGNAAAMNLESVVETAHALEDQLDLLRRDLAQGRLCLPGEADIAAVHAAAGRLEDELQDGDRVFERILGIQQAFGARTSEPFDGLERLLRDTVRTASRLSGKSIDLTFRRSPGLSEDDERIADKIKNSLLQLVRNSVDHGIENVSVRESRGKSVSGRIVVDVSKSTEGLTLTVEDDGGGLDTAKIRERAVARGIVSEREVAAMSRARIFRLIFRSGFSTADGVSELSGRGVGMDIVRDEVKRAGAKLMIKSEVGKFTRFTFVIPAPPP